MTAVPASPAASQQAAVDAALLTGNVDPGVVAAAVTVIGKQENASTGTKFRVVYRIRPGSGSEVRVLVFDACQPAGQFR